MRQPRGSTRGSWWRLTSPRNRSRKWLTGCRLPSNKKHPNYIKKGLKDSLWEQKAREMGKTSDQLKKWYTNEIKVWQAEANSLGFWHHWTNCKGQLDPVSLRISPVLPHRPGQQKGHCQCQYFISLLCFHVWRFCWNGNHCLHVLSLLMTWHCLNNKWLCYGRGTARCACQ